MSNATETVETEIEQTIEAARALWRATPTDHDVDTFEADNAFATTWHITMGERQLTIAWYDAEHDPRVDTSGWGWTESVWNEDADWPGWEATDEDGGEASDVLATVAAWLKVAA